MHTVDIETIGEPIGHDHCRMRRRERDRQRARAKTPLGRLHGAARPCTFEGCEHRVNVHFEAAEDPQRRCSIPDCPCTGYVAPVLP